MFNAAIPVGANKATCFFVLFTNNFNNVDLPVPALPVIKMQRFVFSIKSNAL